MEGATRPYYEHMISCFGVERACSKAIFQLIVPAALTTYYGIHSNEFVGSVWEDKNALFHDTATRVYSVDP
ncbi:MAG: hypothetical protein CM1200mP24_00770 [Gammaproteobacteria bacterium]|nr:MAG: hypothetical protein CM1200mP24_00770 [Gammaproteobacteria bacterium]